MKKDNTELKCKDDNKNGEWYTHYCTNDCNTCEYPDLKEKKNDK